MKPQAQQLENIQCPQAQTDISETDDTLGHKIRINKMQKSIPVALIRYQ